MSRKLKAVLCEKGLKQAQVCTIAENFLEKKLSQARLCKCVNNQLKFRDEEKETVRDVLIFLGIDYRTINSIEEIQG